MGQETELPAEWAESLRNRGASNKKSGQLKKLPARGRKCRRSGKGYSNFSVITGKVSLALARDLTTVASAFSAVVLREVAILFEAVLPVVMRVEFAGFEEAKNFGGFSGTNNGSKANGHGVGLRDHDTQAAGNNTDHEITFGSAVQNSVADLLNSAHTVIRVNDLVADLVVHRFRCPLGDA